MNHFARHCKSVYLCISLGNVGNKSHTKKSVMLTLEPQSQLPVSVNLQQASISSTEKVTGGSLVLMDC